MLEDEQRIREMLVDALGRAGHHVESVADGLAGLARFQGGDFDVVLTDLSLPERSGLEVARAVKRLRPGTPVVLITGWGHLLDPALLAQSGRGPDRWSSPSVSSACWVSSTTRSASAVPPDRGRAVVPSCASPPSTSAPT